MATASNQAEADTSLPKKRVVCSGCKRPARVCICAALPSKPLKLSGKVIVLMHPLERSSASAMTLVAGCYERFLFGYNYDQPDQEAPQLVRRFTHAAHKGVVKCLAAAGQYMASGGADDLIHLYDLKTDKDLGFLMSPGEGAVTALHFFVPAGAYNPTHLLSGSADGSVSVWSVGGGWECMKTMKGHRKDVNALSVHSSGALALSCSRDGTLRMWDLVKGRSTFSSKLESEGECVLFSPSGQTYALLCGSRVTLHAIGGSKGLVGELVHPRRALCMAFSPDGSFLVTGAEDGSLRVWSTKNSAEVLCIPRAHGTRIRGLALPYCPTPHPATPGLPPLIATASSDGIVKLWSLADARLAPADASSAGPQGATCLSEAATKARITSLCALDPLAVMGQRLRESQQSKKGAVAAAAGVQQQRQQGGAGGGGSSGMQGKAKKAKGLRDSSEGRQPRSEQQQQQGKKRRIEGQQPQLQPKGGHEEQQLPPKKKKPALEFKQQQQQQQRQRQEQQQGEEGPRPVSDKKPKKPKPAVTSAAAPPAAGVSEGGVVDFMDAKDWQRAKQKKKKQKAAHKAAVREGGAPVSKRQKGGQGGKSMKQRK